MDFRGLKDRMKPEFAEKYEKYYPVKTLTELGFERRVCTKCGRGFWSMQDRDFCDEPACSGGYRFIGESLTKKKFGYREAWDTYVRVFEKWGYVPLKRYPVVCRWYDQLYFVNAGINDFQPYVVAGEVDPPADAVLEPQFCLRFQDTDSVGITGRHYTGFIMVGQHTFNRPKKYVYFKEEGIAQIHEFLTKGLGIPAHEIFYHEDVWAGGGNFGPSMEFFSRGLELGNQVYMQYELLPDGSHQELKTKVIDMGAGLERWSWFSQGVPMSYDTVFPEVMEYIYKKTGGIPKKDFWNMFARYAGLLSIDEIDDVDSAWNMVAREVGVELSELKQEVYRMRALYAIGDHTRTLLVGVHDGALPSNVGGGYNLRNLLRRCWSLIDEFKLDIELERVFEKHIKEFGRWYTELADVGSLWDILVVERERFEEGRKKGRKIVEKMVSDGRQFDAETLAELYDSQGIQPELIREHKPDLMIPDNFYKLVDERHERSNVSVKEEKVRVPEGLPETQLLYYDDMSVMKFKANVLDVFEDYVVLDQTLFYPEGGGQEADYGVLDGIEVTDTQKMGGIVLHKVKDSQRFKKDQVVEGLIDVDRRFQLTQHHTATHIVNAAAYKVLGPHVWQAGAHKSIESARLDITHYKAVSSEERKAIEDEANRIVGVGMAVKKIVLPRDEAEKRYGFRIYQGGAVPGTELRIVDIAGVDAEACGGIHLDNTRNASKIKLVRATRIQDGVVRLEFKAGKAAEEEGKSEEEIYQECIKLLGKYSSWYDEYSKKFLIRTVAIRSELDRGSKIFGVRIEQLPKTIKRFISEIEEMEGELGYDLAKEVSPFSVGERELLPPMVEYIFSRWKELKKKIVKRGGGKVGEIEKDIKEKIRVLPFVKYITEGLTLPALRELASKMIQENNRVLILVNIVGDKCNVVVASSKPNVNAGDVVGELSKKLGGGGRGDARLGVGGGRSEGAEKILDDFSF